MTFKETMAELFSTAEGTYYKWKKEQRPIIALLEKYFTREELEEFILTGKISSFEMIEEFKMILLGSKLDYLTFVSNHLKHSNKLDFFTDFYYRFLVYINEIQHSSNVSDIQFQNIFHLNDALPSFFINVNNDFAKLQEWEKHNLQYNISQINNMNRNTTNFILLNLSNNFQSLIQRSDIPTSDEYRKASILHSLMFCIYKYHPNLDYEEKVKLLGSVLGMDANIVFEKILWKIIEVEHNKIIEAIKMYK